MSMCTLALLRDGVHEQSRGGGLRLDGIPLLDCPLAPSMMEGARRALLLMVEPCGSPPERGASFRRTRRRSPKRLGAKRVMRSARCRMRALTTRVVSVQVENLSVHDGSLFPSSIGAKPKLIYRIVNELVCRLAKRLTRREVWLA